MPDNTIEWGQGAVNNTNDWGKAKANSTNNFGAVYDSSPSGDTNIVGGTTLSITYSASAYCDGIGDTPQPTVAGNTGAGTFSSTSGIIFADSGSNTGSSTGVIDVDASTDGATYVVTYTDTDAATATATVVILNLDNASFSYSANSYTPTDSDPTPTITGLTGGTFSAGSGLVFVDSGSNTGSSTGEIDLSASTIASYTITYDTTSSGSSVCPNTSTFGLAVTAAYSPLQLQFDTSGGKTITIPGTVGSSFTVDWGDTTVTTETGGTISHTYASGIATSTVSIGAISDSGPLTSFAFNNSGSKNDLLDVAQWGDIEFSSFSSMFNTCSNLDISATDTPDLSNCTNYYKAFYLCGSLTGTLSGVNWNWTFNGGSLIFNEMFMRCELFNGDVSNWNISGATGLSAMFSCYGRPRGVFNRNLNSWDTSSVTNMSSMFYNQSFNGDIYNWDTSNVTTMNSMFYSCISFNQDINTKDTGTRLAWDVSSCSNFSNMFYNTSSFVTSINKWKIKTTGSAFSMSDMFRNANYNQTLNTSEVTVGQGGYQQTYLAWDVQKVNNFYRMFSTSSFNQSLSNWDTSSATTMNSMFTSSSFNQPITSQSVTVGSGSNQRTYNAWDVSLVSDTFRMFRGNTNFNQDLSSWDVSSLSNIGQMFSYSSVFNQNISDWNIINLSNGYLCFFKNNIITTENYTDSIVGWAVTVYNNSGSPSTVNFSGNGKTFDGTRTSDNASGQTYVAKYGANWPSAWTNNNAQDAFDYLTTTLSWSIN